MSKSILIHENGGPEKMQLADVEVGSPGPGQVKIRHTAIGLNFIDIYTRSGLYQTPLPNAVGREAAGVILEVGPRVKGFKKGDRVAYCGVLGAYCQERLMGVDQLVHVPKGVSDEQAAAIMLKGMTTEYLVDHTPKAWLKKGDTILFHAAAGGVGLLFGQWAKARGYKVIGTVSSPEKAALAKKNGYKWVIDYTKQNIVEEVKKITKGKGVPVVVDGVEPSDLDLCHFDIVIDAVDKTVIGAAKFAPQLQVVRWVGEDAMNRCRGEHAHDAHRFPQHDLVERQFANDFQGRGWLRTVRGWCAAMRRDVKAGDVARWPCASTGASTTSPATRWAARLWRFPTAGSSAAISCGSGSTVSAWPGC